MGSFARTVTKSQTIMKLMLVLALASATVLAEPEAANSEVHFILGNQEYRYVLDNFEQAVPVVSPTPENPATAPVAPAVPVDKLVHAAIPHPLPGIPYHIPAIAPAAPEVAPVVKGAFGPVALPSGYHQTVIDQNLKLARPVLPAPVKVPGPEVEAKPVAAPVPVIAPVPVYSHVPAPVPVSVVTPEKAETSVPPIDPSLVHLVVPRP